MNFLEFFEGGKVAYIRRNISYIQGDDIGTLVIKNRKHRNNSKNRKRTLGSSFQIYKNEK